MKTPGDLGRRFVRAMGMASERDARGRRLVAVIECILNQNARDEGAAASAAMILDVLRLCNEYEVGILQMPCPEIAFLGFARKRPSGESIRDALDTEDGRTCCGRIGVGIADRLEEFVRKGYQVLAILGGNPESPGCAVHNGRSGLLGTSGVLMRELQDELRKRSIEAPFRGIRDCDPTMMAEDIAWLEGVLSMGVR